MLQASPLFHVDPRLSTGSKSDVDMTKSVAMAQSFSLANMVPQNVQHNSGAWSKIEQETGVI